MKASRFSSFQQPLLSRLQAGIQKSGPHSCTGGVGARLWMTTTASSFDKETSSIYKRVAENHKHLSGPWTTMMKVVHEKAKDRQQHLDVLDLATGPGEPALLIAQEIPNAHVTATDISPDQIDLVREVLRAEASSLPNMKPPQVVDMQDLSSFFGNDSFDVVTCCYGFMFPPDIPKAIQESYRVLRPGGTLVATTWNRIKMMQLGRQIMTGVLGATPPPPPIDPLSLSEPGLFETMLQEAGYVNLDVANHEYPFDMTDDLHFAFKGVAIPIHEVLNDMNAWDIAEETFRNHMHDFGTIDERGHYMIHGNEYKLTVAQKPK